VGRVSDALAWTCLECELNPLNVAALALKEALKSSLNLGRGHQDADVKKAKGNLDYGLWMGVAGMRDIKAVLDRDVQRRDRKHCQ